ncbi:MAG: lipoate--protein ligase family protein [Anaerolineales bacterium]|nr:lipoate--protein ligase family protein [Anaerolineales bacterium]
MSAIFESSRWRLVITPPLPGAMNMAVDEAILEAAGGGDVPPTLRLYAWEPACLSLGYAQPYTDVFLPGLAAHGWELVRRPTGGRAILHVDELTYSVCGPHDEPRLAGSVLDSYRVLAGALLRALHMLDIPAQANEKSRQNASSQAQNPVCFEAPSNYEIIVQGKKLVGSAQRRSKDGVLQHGSLPLCGDLSRITLALAFPNEQERRTAAQRLLQRAATAEMILGRPLAWEQAAQAFAAAFADELNLEFIRADLTEAELQRAEQLLEERYANPGWMQRS